MTTDGAENNPQLTADEFALLTDAVTFALLPGKRFLPRTPYPWETAQVSAPVADDCGLAALPNFIIVDRSPTGNDYRRYAFYVTGLKVMPFTDSECIAYLRQLGASL